MEAHAGPTPMGLRRDALQVATVIMQEVVAIANRYPPYGRGTVGMVQVFPNSRNVIPGEVKFSIDLRNVNDELLNTMHEEMLAFVDKVRAAIRAWRSASSGCPTIRLVPSTPTAWARCARPPRRWAIPPWTWCRGRGTTRSMRRGWRRRG